MSVVVQEDVRVRVSAVVATVTFTPPLPRSVITHTVSRATRTRKLMTRTTAMIFVLCPMGDPSAHPSLKVLSDAYHGRALIRDIDGYCSSTICYMALTLVFWLG